MLKDLSWLKKVKLIDEDGNFINSNNPLPVFYRFFNKINWTSDIDFNKGSLTNVEVIDSGDETCLQLEENEDNSDDVPFTTPSNYIYDTNEIEFSSGKAQLKSSITADNNWSFTTPANYSYDANKIEVSGGVAKLKGIPVIPYAWYHLNESSGSVASDSSGNGRNGTTVNSPSWVSGKLNNGLQISTSNQYVNLGDIASFERTQAFSIGLWIKSTEAGTLIGRRENGGLYRGWDIMYSAGKIYFYFANTTVSNMISVYTNYTLADGNWHYLVITYDGSSNANGVNIYIDGALKSKIIQYNSLTATTITTTYCSLAARAGSNVMKGFYDDVEIHTKVLSLAEILFRYDLGNGIESMLGAYDTNNPMIYPSTGYNFISEITEFVEMSIKPINTEIKYHVSSDDGVTWKYWNGSEWVITDNSYTQANLANTIATQIYKLASSGTFRFRVLLHTEDELIKPELDNIYINFSTYPTGGKEIEMNWDIQPVHNFEYLIITEIVIKPDDTDIKYQYSVDSGLNYNGSWLTALELQTILQGINGIGDGSDKIRFKFQLLTENLNQTPKIDNLNILSNSGYKLFGEFESNIYNSAYYSLDWETILFALNIPDDCSITIYVRASNNLSDMGSYGIPVSSGENLVVTGKYIQWKAVFVGNGQYTPQLEQLSLDYDYPYRIEYRP